MSIVEFYKTFRLSRWQTTEYTPEKNSHSWDAFWFLVVCSGFEFKKDDLVELRTWSAKDCSRSFYAPDERHYAAAVSDSNIHFCIAYERLKGRKPFIAKHCLYRGRGGYTRHSLMKTQGRLVIGTRFKWKGHEVEVTSFKDDANAMIACAYHPRNPNKPYARIKIAKRFRITHKDWLATRIRS